MNRSERERQNNETDTFTVIKELQAYFSELKAIEFQELEQAELQCCSDFWTKSDHYILLNLLTGDLEAIKSHRHWLEDILKKHEIANSYNAAKIYHLRALLTIAQEKYEEAHFCLEKELRLLSSHHADYFVRLSQNYLRQAEVYIREKNIPDAVVYLQITADYVLTDSDEYTRFLYDLMLYQFYVLKNRESLAAKYRQKAREIAEHNSCCLALQLMQKIYEL